MEAARAPVAVTYRRKGREPAGKRKTGGGPPRPRNAPGALRVSVSPMSRCRCVDCGFPLSETATLWPTCAPLRRDVHKRPETTEDSTGARNKQSVSLNCGSGTHIDAPAHFVAGGRTIEQLTTDELAQVPLAVIDLWRRPTLTQTTC